MTVLAMNWKELFEQARALALKAHASQRYGDKPYEYHLQAVVEVLFRFGISLDDQSTAPILIGAWLHDTLEDTALTRGEIERRFGPEIADLVWRVTDEPGTVRSDRKKATYPKIRESESAVILKLADRIANVEESLANNKELLQKYRQEHDGFKQALKRETPTALAAEMWKHLDSLVSREISRSSELPDSDFERIQH